ncbi:MAG: MBL fold metallo-hydrolase [Gammaproteobacteria bacterium]|nr:MBL fold metallo-hydrolase [Gammaproteobacteria bacterium]NND47917.1 MBL fold metallo-hydrolase [Woeseiaceae bacterium]
MTMWRQRAKQAALIAVAALVVSAAVLVWLWNNRPNLDKIGWPSPELASAAVTDSVIVTWLGVTTLLFDDGETQILIDGFFSRPSLIDVALRRRVVNDAATINYALDEYRMRRLAAIVPAHSHFDHAMDVGAIANRSSASVLGSESTAQVARGAGVPEDQITIAVGNRPYTFGRFTVTLLPSPHAPLGWRGSVPLAGTIATPLTMPQPVSAWREGGSYSILISHPQGTTIVQGSAGFSNDPLLDIRADVVMLGVGGLTSLGKDYAEQYWQSLVTATGAHSVYPVHFDDFTKPFGQIAPQPKFISNIETIAEWLEAFRNTWDNDVQLFMPEFGQPVAIYAQPAPEA